MTFDIRDATDLLARTPVTLRALLHQLPDTWTRANEGGASWSPADVLAHLVYCDEENWIRRARQLLTGGHTQPFVPLDRTGGAALARSHSTGALLDAFAAARAAALVELRDLPITPADYDAPGLHPEFGPVTLQQLLSAWVVHDLGHVAQVSRVLAAQYRDAVGPWIAYLRILR